MCIWRVHLQKSDISARRRMYYEGEKKKTADFYEQVVVVQFDAIDATYVSQAHKCLSTFYWISHGKICIAKYCCKYFTLHLKNKLEIDAATAYFMLKQFLRMFAIQYSCLQICSTLINATLLSPLPLLKKKTLSLQICCTINTKRTLAICGKCINVYEFTKGNTRIKCSTINIKGAFQMWQT